MTLPVVQNADERPRETWADPRRGTIRWQTLFSRGVTATDSLVCGCAHLVPGETFASHHHAEAEVYFGLEGSVTVVIDGVPTRLEKGTAIFIPSNAVHGIPDVAQEVRYFYAFATDSFDDITYHFEHEAPASA